jgi:phosphoserine phosphatase
MKRFALVAFDLDGVLVEPESSWVHVHRHFGVSNEDSLVAYLKGDIDDDEFMRRDIALWKRAKPDICEADIDSVLDGIAVTRGARETVAALKAARVSTAIVSGGLKHLARRVADETGIDHVLANGLAADAHGRLLGHGLLEVELNAKGKVLASLMKRLGVGRGHCAAVGNSFIDVQMFEAAGYGIAFDPVDDAARKAADEVVETGDLRDVLPFLL